jgi:hypothetical protein
VIGQILDSHLTLENEVWEVDEKINQMMGKNAGRSNAGIDSRDWDEKLSEQR